MDWEANLAAIIKCTDASLAHQFREFEDVTAEFTAVDEGPAAHNSSSDNVATNYLRETMAAEYHHRQQQEKQQTRDQKPSYSRVSGAFSKTSAAPATTFSEHFHRRQERKRGAAASGRPRDNQRTHRRSSEYEPAEDEGQVQDHEVDEQRYATLRGGGAYHPQMYSSPTYDVAQMMEQVRLSLKLEVDARAAIAERQLSALLHLCKTTSEELDRLRVEVCANDRQLHTLDQVQSKIRQELTTQKDIGFHLQSMCGKDESWRMQTENQLLELRQIVAALREQGNSTQAVAQEKLSRSELLVQFNAAMEPIKAQLQANLQHQAQQIADITRTTSSSSLLLDGITQKVNRGITEELNELRSDLNALKHHVAKMDIFQDGGRGQSRSLQQSKEEIEAKTKEEQQQQEEKLTDLREGLQKELMALVKDYVEAQTKPIRQSIDENQHRIVTRSEIENLRGTLDETCRSRCASTVMQLESQVKSVQDQLRGECNAVVRDASDRIERSIQQTTNTMTTALDGQVKTWQNKQIELVTMIENEQKERKQAFDELHESLRKSRHQLEDQLHKLGQEGRTKLSQYESDIEKRLKDVEKQIECALVDVHKKNQAAMASLKSARQVQDNNNTVEMERKLKRLEETVLSINLSVAALSKSIESSTATSSALNSDCNTKDVSLALEKQTSVYVSTMENLIQKLQLQLQVQAQPQVQMMAPSPFHGFWPPSPHATSQAPPPPMLHLPSPSAPISTTDQSQVTPTTIRASLAALAPSSYAHVDDSVKDDLDRIEVPTYSDISADRVRSSVAVKPSEPSSTISTEPCRLPPPPVVPSSLTSPMPDQDIQQSSEQNLSIEVELTKRENTLATTAKGALAEAELAKARVEGRRRQEQETKQQQRQPPVPVPSVNTQQLQWVSLEMHELECNTAQRRTTNPPGTVASSEAKPLSDTATELGGSLRKCRHCAADVPSLDLLEHEINCDKVLKQCPHCLRRQKMSELQDHIENCDCRLVSCPNDCGGKFLQRGIPNHLATRCFKKPVGISTSVAPPVSRPPYPEASKAAPSPSTPQHLSAPAPTGKVECKFCDDEIDANKIDAHELNCDWKPKRCQHCNMVVISRDLLRHETSCKTNMKSCSHCDENMPQSALATHASRCSKRPIKCIRCCQLFPADAIVAHSTNCKVVPGGNSAASSQTPAVRAPIKIPPPPPFPPPPTATTPTPTSQQNTRRATADPRVGVTASIDTVKAPATQAEESDRLARRNLVLSQLTNPGATPTEHNTGSRASAPSPVTRPIIQPDVEDDEDEEDEDDDEDDDDQLTLAQVVKEWNIENVCLWLHEDVGVPDVVLRFQQKQCNGEMLLELTESDLINDFGVKDRVQRERILSAIEAINTSNAFSEEDDDEDDEEEGDEDDLEKSEEQHTSHMRHSIGGVYSHPRDILQRRSQPSPQRMFGGQLPSSNDMLRRISNALESPKLTINL
ncbi:hypothetical protein PI124_g4454 [Phytophthora idaei]|nr:hypothetical protein PI124_g4454 [Phytophthora idaei]